MPNAQLERRRQQIRRGLRRANTAGAVVLVIVIGLSLAALIQALRADRNAQAATEASARGQQELWKAQLAQATAQRSSGQARRKAQGLEAITSAAAIEPSVELRNEAIAILALTDVAESGTWHAAQVYGSEVLAFDSNLETYAVGNAQGLVKTFLMSNGANLTQFQGPPVGVVALQFSRNGRMLGGSFRNGDVTVWRISDGGKVVSWNSGFPNRNLASFDLSPDGTHLAIANGEPQVRILNLEQQQETDPLKVDSRASDVLFAPTGKMLGVAVSNRVELWEWPGRKLVRSLTHAGQVTAFDWSPDGRRVACSSLGTADIELWDIVTGRDRQLRGHAEIIPHLTFDHQGELLVSFSWDGSTRFWQADDGELLFVSRSGFGLEFDQAGKRLVYSREQQGFGLWDVSRSSIYRELTLPLGATSRMLGLDFSPDGRKVALLNPEGAHVFDLASRSERGVFALTNPLSVWFAADDRLVTVTRSEITRWKMADPEGTKWQIDGQMDVLGLKLDFGTITRATRPVVAVPANDNVFWFDLSDARSLHRLSGEGRMGALTGAAVSANTNWVATTYWKGGDSSIWDTRTGKRVQELGRNGGYVAFSPDDRWLLIGSAHHYAVWDTASWQSRFEFNRETTGQLVGTGAFSPDSKLLAICPQVNQVQLIGLPSGKVLATLNSPLPRNIGTLAFSPDGATLAAATFDTQLQVWNLPEIRKELAELGLNWTDNDGVPQRVQNPARVQIAVPSGSRTKVAQTTFYWLDGLGVLAAMFIGLYTLRYHQRMVSSYEEVERLVAERNRELKLAQVELLHSQKMKALGTLAAGVAHDFNNLLSVIRMGNQLQGREGVSPEDKLESGQAVERAVEQGKKVVRSMLGYSREPGEGRQFFSVPEMVDEVVLLLNKQFLGGLTLTLELNRATPPVTALRGRIEQILLNLIVNAAEAMAGEGRLLIAVREVREVAANGSLLLRPRSAVNYVELVVKDNGPGIEPTVRDRIFEPFFSTKPQSASSGTGLGLSLVHSLAEQEGLGLSLESEKGKGTTFRVIIPVEPADTATRGLAALEERTGGTERQLAS